MTAALMRIIFRFINLEQIPEVDVRSELRELDYYIS
jgi:hypothetical protein